MFSNKAQICLHEFYMFTFIDINFYITYDGHQKPSKCSQKVFWPILMTFICDVEIEIKMCEPHYINLFFFVNLFHSPGIWFSGGLSLHLNHLIVEWLSAPYWQFGTLPIGIFLSNLDSRQLETSLMTSYGHFWNLSTFGSSRAVRVFWPKLGVFRKSKFSWWRSNGASMQFGGFR